MVSRRIGEKNYQEAANVTFQLLVTGTVLALAMGFLATWYAADLLALLGAEADVIEYGLRYARSFLPVTWLSSCFF
ncbi:MATE family efflux transporter [Pontibacter sp. BAB1700]|uniref:MATE family efflux transporter n=1 Tax=Pontibacter sp. BAB1700 TaxID=1144253 RepID=UPI00026BE13A|nr:MATE efflux family protein [Pontibacter sp. BAB1700]